MSDLVIAEAMGRLRRVVSLQPCPLVFATISGAHLYGFPSPDSDYDLRGCHLLPLREEARLAHVADLIARKLSGPERSILNDSDYGFHQRKYECLLSQLEAAHQASALPEAPAARDALNDLLVRLRLRTG